jgi:rubredoxin
MALTMRRAVSESIPCLRPTSWHATLKDLRRVGCPRTVTSQSMPADEPDQARVAFESGMTAGLEADPQQRPADPRTSPEARQRITTLRSPWLHQRCDVCGHSFPARRHRVGPTADAARGTTMPGLRCASASPAASPAASPPQYRGARGAQQQRPTGFYDGLITAWPLPDDVPLTRLEEGHPYCWPRRRPRPRRAACKVCGHTFRPARPGRHLPLRPGQPQVPSRRASRRAESTCTAGTSGSASLNRHQGNAAPA